MEKDLNNLDWNPHTCDCVVDITREDTVVDAIQIQPMSGEPPKGSRVVLRDGVLKREVPRYRTTTTSKNGTPQHRIHDIGANPPPGSRLRGTVSSPCPGHVGFSDVVQTQRVKVRCGCTWTELHAGEKKQNGFFGAQTEIVCEGHAARIVAGEFESKDIREIARADNRTG